jgi:hypothetical protein
MPAFDIHLKFTCLREAPPPEALRRAGASAKAGILKLEISYFLGSSEMRSTTLAVICLAISPV